MMCGKPERYTPAAHQSYLTLFPYDLATAEILFSALSLALALPFF